MEQTKELILNQKRQLSDVYSGYTYFAENDVLLAKITPCFENGKLGIARNLENSIGFGSSEFFVFRTKGRIIPEYLFYFLSNEQFRTDGKRQMTGAVGHKRVPKEFIENYKLPFPTSLDEQKRIVKILDEEFAAIDKAKANAEKNLQNSRELFESYLNKVFANPGEDWEEKKLKDVIKLEYGKPLDKTKREIKGLYPVYGANGEKARSNEYYFDKKSIIVGRKGSAGEINVTAEKFWPLDVTYFVTFDERQYDLKFLFHLLSTLNLPRLAKGVKPGINRNDVYSLDVLIPPLPEQKQLVEKLDEISSESKNLEKVYQQKLADLEELKKSILQKAFEGELTRNNG